MFNMDTNFHFQNMRTSAGTANIVVRWPTDEEWIAHNKRKRIVQTNIGRGVHTSVQDTGEADLKLYESIKLDGAPPLNTDEATYIIELIARCEVTSLEVGAEEAAVQLTLVKGAEAKHAMRIPTIGEMRRLQRLATVMVLPYSRFQIRPNLEAAAALWDQCGGRAEGYAGPVPNIHKDAAIRAVIQALENEAQPKPDEGNF